MDRNKNRHQLRCVEHRRDGKILYHVSVDGFYWQDGLIQETREHNERICREFDERMRTACA